MCSISLHARKFKLKPYISHHIQLCLRDLQNDHQGAESDVITLGSLYLSLGLDHTTVSDVGEWEGVAPSLILTRYL